MEIPGIEITAARTKVYPKHVHGRFRKLRNVFSCSLQAACDEMMDKVGQPRGLVHRAPLGIDAVRVVQPGGQLALVTPDGRITNIFKLSLINRRAERETVFVECEGLGQVQLAGLEQPIVLEPGEVRESQVLLVASQSMNRGGHPIRFRIKNQQGTSNRANANFFVP